MKIIQFNNEDNCVVDIINARKDATNENIIVIYDIPKFEPKEGYNGVLKYDQEKQELYWDYEEIVIEEIIIDEEQQETSL